MQDVQSHLQQEDVGGGIGGQQHATGEAWFKLDPPKPFEGKTVDGSLLESWRYQMDLYFAIKFSIPTELQVAHAVLLLTGNAPTWFCT